MKNILIKKQGDTPTGLYNGCLISIPMWSLLILLIWIACSCTPKPHIITERTGIIVAVTPNTIEVMYNIVNREHQSRAMNIYYWPQGHGYKIGDTYPPCISFYDKQ